MDALELVDKLAARARAEAAPRTSVDVAELVRNAPRERLTLWPMGWSAAAAAIAASVVLVVAFSRGTEATTARSSDALAGMFSVTELEMP